MKHDECKGCKYEHCSMESKECMGCKQNAVDKYTRMTQADRIRSFSDDELAEWFSTITDDVLRGSTWSKDGWMKYLQSEVEE